MGCGILKVWYDEEIRVQQIYCKYLDCHFETSKQGAT
jgi:hypothetical protein